MTKSIEESRVAFGLKGLKIISAITGPRVTDGLSSRPFAGWWVSVRQQSRPREYLADFERCLTEPSDGSNDFFARPHLI